MSMFRVTVVQTVFERCVVEVEAVDTEQAKQRGIEAARKSGRWRIEGRDRHAVEAVCRFDRTKQKIPAFGKLP
jgi:hypothetical protein